MQHLSSRRRFLVYSLGLWVCIQGVTFEAYGVRGSGLEFQVQLQSYKLAEGLGFGGPVY